MSTTMQLGPTAITRGGGELWPLGDRGLILLPPPPPSDAPEGVRNGIAAQRVAKLHGACPLCGGNADEPQRHPDGSLRRVTHHQAGCAASDPVLRERVAAWRRR